MSSHINHLNITRKKSGLTQSDMATLLGIKEHSSICRHEKGKRTPPIDMILSYHIIFDRSVEDLFYGYRKILIEKIKNRIPLLIEELQQLQQRQPTPRIMQRLELLSNINHRLSALSTLSPISALSEV